MTSYTIARSIALLAVSSLILTSCKQKEKDYSKNDPIFTNRDTTVKPGDDFFQYANGAWLKKNPIPAAYSSWGIGRVVQEELRDRLKKINEDALKENAAKGTNSQKIGDFYYSGMDTVNIEKQGILPLIIEMDRIDGITDTKTLVDEFAHLSTIGVTTPIGAFVGQDAKNSNKMVLQLWQSGIGLPNRDYYFNTDEHSVAIRTDYQQKHLPVIFKLAAVKPDKADQAAKKIYALETFLADSSRKLQDLRDPYKNYNKMPVAALSKLAPDIDWKNMFVQMEFKNVDTVIVGQPEYYRAVNKALKTYTIDDWKAYLTKNLITEYSAYLSKGFDEENFRFYGAIISGRKAQFAALETRA